MKTCRKCNISKSSDNFVKISKNKDGLYSYCYECKREAEKERYHKTKVLKPKIIPKTKICCSCKKEFPRNREFFFKKTMKQKTADGTIKTYHSFRSDCKDCHAKKGNNRRLKKRFKELGIDSLEEYKEAYIFQGKQTRRENPEIFILDIPDDEKRKINIWCLRYGYKFTNLESFYKAKEEKHRELLTKSKRYLGDLPEGYNKYKDIPKEKMREILRNRLGDAKIANWLDMSVSDCPKEMIEAKRLTYKINRLIDEIT